MHVCVLTRFSDHVFRLLSLVLISLFYYYCYGDILEIHGLIFLSCGFPLLLD